MNIVRTSIVIVAAGVTPLTNVLAQEDSTRPRGSLEEVLVTAQKQEQGAQDVPISITPFSAEALAARGVTAAREIAAYTPSMQWKGAFGFASPTIFLRGIGDNTFQANNVSAVGVYFDEVYIASGSALNQLAMDLERVEVLKGPQGTLYGRNTTGGAVNFITRKPRPGESFGIRGTATAGSYGERSIESAVQMPMGDKAALRVAARVEEDDGPFRFTAIGEDGRSVRANAWRALFDVQPSDELEVLLGVHGSHTAADALMKMTGTLDPLTFEPCPRIHVGSGCVDFSGFAGSDSILQDHGNVRSRERKIESFGASGRLTWSTDNFTLTSISALETNDRTHREDIDHAPADWIQQHWLTEADQFSQELRLSSAQESASTRWILGAFYSREDLEAFQSFTFRDFGPGILTVTGTTLEGVAQKAKQEDESFALFGEVYRDLGSRVTLTAGVRGTYEKKDVDLSAWIFDADATSPAIDVDERFARSAEILPTVAQAQAPSWTDVTGRLVLDFKATDDVLLYASLARGFKSGGFNGGALFAQEEATIVDPEYLDALELGIKSDLLAGRLRLNAAAFYYDFRDQQVFVLESAGPALVQTLSNAGKSSVLGFESEIEAMPTDALYFSFGLSYLDAEFDEFKSGDADRSGNKLPASPEISANGLARYSWMLPNDGKLSLQGDFTYRDDQFFDASNNPTLRQEGYWLTNARLAYDSPRGAYSLSVWGKNLADKRYFVDGFDNSAFGWNVYVPGPPSTYGVTLSFNFE